MLHRQSVAIENIYIDDERIRVDACGRPSISRCPMANRSQHRRMGGSRYAQRIVQLPSG